MDGNRLRECLYTLRWTESDLAEVLDCDFAVVLEWAMDHQQMPSKVAAWLETLAEMHRIMVAEAPRRDVGLRSLMNAAGNSG